MVRTFLADWIHTRPTDAPDRNWSPRLPTDSLEFPYKVRHGSQLWECQCVLQEAIAGLDRVYKDMPASPHLIILFILAFSGISVCDPHRESRWRSVSAESSEHPSVPSTEHDDIPGYSFGSPLAPQAIQVYLHRCDENDEARISLKLIAGSSVDAFKWTDWIDAAMGYMKGADAGYTADHELKWRKRTPAKCDLTRPLPVIPKGHPELPELKGDIRVWTGWPIFDVKVVQFEMNQWMGASGLMRGFGEVVPRAVEEWNDDISEEDTRTEAGLFKITGWNRT